jgi:hypothetical protein
MIKCECGKEITKKNKNDHKKTFKHIKWVNDEYIKEKEEYAKLFKLKRELEYPKYDIKGN